MFINCRVGPVGVLCTILNVTNIFSISRMQKLYIILQTQMLLKNPKIKKYFHSSPKKQRFYEIIKANMNLLNVEV